LVAGPYELVGDRRRAIQLRRSAMKPNRDAFPPALQFRYPHDGAW